MSGFLSTIETGIGKLIPSGLTPLGGNLSGITPSGGSVGNTIGNLLFGTGSSATPDNPEGLFTSGWGQIFANLVLILVGLILIISGLKGHSPATTVNVLASGALPAKSSTIGKSAEIAA